MDNSSDMNFELGFAVRPYYLRTITCSEVNKQGKKNQQGNMISFILIKTKSN